MMTIVSLLLFLLALYIGLGICTYAYAVVKNFELTDNWSFKMRNRYIGVIKCPKWSMFWIEMILSVKDWS